MPKVTTEADFTKMIEGATLGAAEVALLRHDRGLPYDEAALKPHLQHRVLENRLRMIAWCKLREPEDKHKPPSAKDTFMSNVDQLLRGEGKAADELIEEVARRLLEIDMINPAVTQRVVYEVYGSFPRPPDFSKRLWAKCQELLQRRAAV
jgi:hypothetical protein